MTEQPAPQSSKIAKISMRTVPINSISPAKYNPRVDLQPGDAEYEKIKNSLEGFGYVDPLIMNEHNGVLISGHQRLKILKQNGYTHADVSIVDIKDEKKEKAMNMAMNNIRGREDFAKLKEIFLEFDVYDELIAMAGYEQEEFDNVKNFQEEIPDDDLGKTPAEAKKVYDEGAIKQIVLYFQPDEYEQMIQKMANVAEKKKLENNTDVVKFLVDFYEQFEG